MVGTEGAEEAGVTERTAAVGIGGGLVEYADAEYAEEPRV